jgi:hypothetical protein
MAKLKPKFTDLQEEIILAWAAKQDTTPEEVLGRVITSFAVDMGLDPTEPEADQLADLQRITGKLSAKKAAREAAKQADAAV